MVEKMTVKRALRKTVCIRSVVTG